MVRVAQRMIVLHRVTATKKAEAEVQTVVVVAVLSIKLKEILPQRMIIVLQTMIVV